MKKMLKLDKVILIIFITAFIFSFPYMGKLYINFLEDFWYVFSPENFGKYDFDGISLIISTLLTLLTICLAYGAFKISSEAKNISTKALESERPILVISETHKDLKSISIANEGKSDARNVSVFVKPSINGRIQKVELYESINISSKIKILLKLDQIIEDYSSIIIYYENALTSQQYILGINYARSDSIEVRQIGETFKTKVSGNEVDLNSPVKYEEYLLVYRDIHNSKLTKQKIVEKISSL